MVRKIRGFMNKAQRDRMEELAHEFHDKGFGPMEEDSVSRVCFKLGYAAALKESEVLVEALKKWAGYSTHEFDYGEPPYTWDDCHDTCLEALKQFLGEE